MNRLISGAMIATAIFGATAISSCSSAKSETANQESDSLILLVGSYSDPSQEGVSIYSFNQSTAESKRLTGLAGISNPSFVIFNPEGSLIYSVGEDAGVSSTVNTIAFNRDSLTLQLLDSKPTGGGAPCHVALSPDGRYVLTANYLGGSLTVYPLDSAGIPQQPRQLIGFKGQGADPERQATPHAHFATFTPDCANLWVTDLGTDRIHIFPVNSTGKQLVDSASMADFTLPAGAGPRHVDFHPSLKRAYLIDEIDGMVNVLGLEHGKPELLQRIAADSVGAQGSGDIHLTPDGRHLYASNRLKDDGLAIFSVDPTTGLLTRTGYQPTAPHPRNFAITPNGRFLLLASRDGNVIEIYRIDQKSGALTAVPDMAIKTPKPVCLKFLKIQDL